MDNCDKSLRRENFSIFFAGNTYELMCSIPDSLLEKRPIERGLNLTCAKEAILKSLEYDNLRTALEYELNHRKGIYDAIAKNYEPNANHETDIHPFFEELNIDPKVQKGLARVAYSCYSEFNRQYEKISKKGENGLRSLNNQAKELCLERIINQEKIYFEKEKGKKPNYIERFSRRELNQAKKALSQGKDEILHQFGSMLIHPEITRHIQDEALKDNLNLFWFGPDMMDIRNFLQVMQLEQEWHRFGMNDLNASDFKKRLVYVNYGRPFEDLNSAVLGRELVVNYLNNLLEKA